MKNTTKQYLLIKLFLLFLSCTICQSLSILSRVKRTSNTVTLDTPLNLYTEDDPAAAIVQDVTFGEDFGNITSVRVTCTSKNANLSPPSSINDVPAISVTTSSPKDITVSGLSSNDQYAEVLRTTNYGNNEVEVGEGIDIITFSFAREGFALNVDTTSIIFLTPVDDATTVAPTTAPVNSRPSFMQNTKAESISEDVQKDGYIPSTMTSLVYDYITDPDADSLKGVAVLYADDSNGNWSYFRLGTPWTNIVAKGVFDSDGNLLRDESLTPSGRNVFLIPASTDGTEFLRFLPNPDFNGVSTIVFVPWDRTEGNDAFDVKGQAVTWDADSTAFGTAILTLTFTITPTQDAPLMSEEAKTNGLHLGSHEEDTTDTIEYDVASFLSACSDVDMPYDDTLLNLGIVITDAERNNGDWKFKTTAGGAYNNMDSFGILLGANGDVSSQKIKFIPDEDFSGDARIYFKCWDFTNGGTNGDFVTISSTDNSYSIDEGFAYVTMTDVNDAPSFSSSSDVALPTYPEDPSTNSQGSSVSALLSTVFIDPDDGTTVGIAVVGMTDPAEDGQFEYTCDDSTWLQFNGGTWRGYIINSTPGPVIATVLAGYCKIRFNPDSSFSFTSPSSSVISVLPWDQSDGVAVASTGVETDSTSASGAYGSTTLNIVPTYTEPPGRPTLTSSTMGTTISDLVFTENDPQVLILDIEITKYVYNSMQTATVTLSGSVDVEEILVFGSSEAGKFASEVQLTSDTSITMSWNSDHTVLTFSGIDSYQNYQQALQSVLYTHTSDNPTHGNRQVSFVVTDGIGVISRSLDRTITVVPVNDAPQLTYDLKTSVLWNEVQFTQSGPAINIFKNINFFTITDSDDVVISSMTVQITNSADASEKLQVPTSVTVDTQVGASTQTIKTVTPITSYDSSSGTLTITLPTTEDYAKVLLEVLYINEEGTPTFHDRKVTAFVTDAAGLQSQSVDITIQMLDTTGTYLGNGGSNNARLSPSIISVVAIAATNIVDGKEVHTDAKYGSGDSIVITFNFETNMAPFGHYDATSEERILTRAQVDSLFSFSSPLAPVTDANAYTGKWTDGKTFVIQISYEADSSFTPKISVWNMSPTDANCGTDSISCIRDSTGTSDPSTTTSPQITENWGLSVPLVGEIVVNNENVPSSTLTSSKDYIGGGSVISFILQPPFTDTEVAYLCTLHISAIIGNMTSLTSRQLTATVSTCNNQALSGGSTSSVIIIVLAATGSQPSSFNQETFSNEVSIDTQQSIDISAQTTGVSPQSYIKYGTTRSLSSSPPVYLTFDDNLTPKVSSQAISRGSDNNTTDLHVHMDDEITIVFDRSTYQPPVATVDELDKVFIFTPPIPAPGYQGQWLDDKTLKITLLAEPSESTYELKLTFQSNQFVDLTSIPNDYADKTACIGANICGTAINDANVGICDTTLNSCRANGEITLSFIENSSPTSASNWWWIMLLCIFILISWIVIAWLGRKLYLTRISRKTNLNSGRTGSFFCRSSFADGDDRPSSEALSLRPTTATTVGDNSNNNNNDIEKGSFTNSPSIFLRHNKVSSVLGDNKVSSISASPMSLGLDIFATAPIPGVNTPIGHDVVDLPNTPVTEEGRIPSTTSISQTENFNSQISLQSTFDKDASFASAQNFPPNYDIQPNLVDVDEHLRDLPGYRSSQDDVIDMRNKIVYERSVSRHANRRKSIRFSESELQRTSQSSKDLQQIGQKSWPSVREMEHPPKVLFRQVKTGWNVGNSNLLSSHRNQIPLSPVPSPLTVAKS